MSLISGNETKIFAKGVIGNVRKAQEDSHGYQLGTPNGDLFVVCDGMGGHVGGAMASKIAVDSIIAHITGQQFATPVEALNGALQFANMQILGYANAHPEFRGMGTTACIVLVQDDGVWIAHVGDSRIYLYLGKEHQLHRITKDHSYVQTLVDAGQITDDQAEHHPNKNRILKALGINPDLHPTFNFDNLPIHPKNGDIFLICSDGLSGMIPDSTIERTMGESLHLHQKGERLIELAMIGETVQPGGQDNCTLELIEVDNSNYNNSQFKSFNPYRPAIPQQPEIPPAAPQSPSQPTTASNSKPRFPFKKIILPLIALLALAGIVLILKGPVQNNKINKAKANVEAATIERDKAKDALDKALLTVQDSEKNLQKVQSNPEARQKASISLEKNKKIADQKQRDFDNAEKKCTQAQEALNKLQNH